MLKMLGIMFCCCLFGLNCPLFAEGAGPAGYWPMDEGAWSGAANEVKDASGRNDNGTAIDGANTAANGKFGRCGSFNGFNNYVSIPSTGDLKYAGGDMSFSFWVKIDPAETDGGFIISKPAAADTGYVWAIYLNAAHQLQVGDQSSWGSSFTPALDTDAWHHAAVTIGSDRQMKIYIDGAEKVSQTHTIAAWLPSDLPLAIGTVYPYGVGWEGSGPLSFKGQLDDVAVWNRVLSAAEVSALWNNGSGQAANTLTNK